MGSQPGSVAACSGGGLRPDGSFPLVKLFPDLRQLPAQDFDPLVRLHARLCTEVEGPEREHEAEAVHSFLGVIKLHR